MRSPNAAALALAACLLSATAEAQQQTGDPWSYAPEPATDPRLPTGFTLVGTGLLLIGAGATQAADVGRPDSDAPQLQCAPGRPCAVQVANIGEEDYSPGVGMIASRLQVPVVPVRLEGLDRILHHKWKFPRRGRARVAFGRHLTLEDTDYAALAERVESAVKELGARS